MSLVILCSLSLLSLAHGLDLSSYLCKLNDPNIENCAVDAANKVLAILFDGIPEANLPDLHEYRYPDVEYSDNDVTIKYSEGVLHGLDTLHMDDIKYDFINNLHIFYLTLKKLQLESNYDIKGKIANEAISSRGKARITMENIKLTVKLSYELNIKNDNIEYFHVLSNTIESVPEKVRVEFDDIYEDSAETIRFNAKLNSNKEEILKHIVPSVNKIINDYLYLHLIDETIDNMPFSELFI